MLIHQEKIENEIENENENAFAIIILFTLASGICSER